LGGTEPHAAVLLLLLLLPPPALASFLA